MYFNVNSLGDDSDSNVNDNSSYLSDNHSDDNNAIDIGNITNTDEDASDVDGEVKDTAEWIHPVQLKNITQIEEEYLNGAGRQDKYIATSSPQSKSPLH